MPEPSIDAQHVIDALRRQITDLVWDKAMLEAQLRAAAAGEEADRGEA